MERQLNHWNCPMSLFFFGPELIYILFNSFIDIIISLYGIEYFYFGRSLDDLLIFYENVFGQLIPNPRLILTIFIRSMKGKKKKYPSTDKSERIFSIFPCALKDDEWIKHMCLCVCLELISHSPNIDFIVIKCK